MTGSSGVGSYDYPTLRTVHRIMVDQGCKRILVKLLAENDNSKQQIYLGSDFESVNLIPNLHIEASGQGKKGPIYKAALPFSWLDAAGNESPALASKIIMYPQYPEIRFSGFLQGCRDAPSELMKATPRKPGRVLTLGVREDGKVYGIAVPHEANFQKQLELLPHLVERGIFIDITDSYDEDNISSRDRLIAVLRRISAAGWIDSKQLQSSGGIRTCNNPNCGGYTLEAELGITPNGFSDPDYLGWEVKQHTVSHFERRETGVLTLMTPEPTGGIYKERGIDIFIRKYGYPDQMGRDDRLNFGGTHRVCHRHPRTTLKLDLIGYDKEQRKITDVNGALVLKSEKGTIAASWDFASLMRHWNRKHSQAVYVPSKRRLQPRRQYCFGPVVRIGEGTDFLKVLEALERGSIYYDPGIKMENASSPHPKIKRRSQFRIKSRELSALYNRMTEIDVFAE